MVTIVVTDKGHVEHKNVALEEKVSTLEIKQTVDLINKFLIGTPIDEVSIKLEFEVKPKIGASLKQQKAIYDALYNVLTDLHEEPSVHVTKPSNILKQPEFNDADKIRNILNKFEDKEFIQNVVESDYEDGTGIHIYIGSENAFDEDVTVIKTNYSVGGEEGTIALIGPKRMEYDRVTTLLEFIKNHINE